MPLVKFQAILQYNLLQYSLTGHIILFPPANTKPFYYTGQDLAQTFGRILQSLKQQTITFKKLNHQKPQNLLKTTQALKRPCNILGSTITNPLR